MQRQIHRQIWESANGPIERGYAVHHKDGNHTNNDLENLELRRFSDHSSVHARASLRARDPVTGRFAGTGHVDEKGYRRVTKGRARYREHRLLWEESYGPIPKGYDIHHKDGDKTHNVLENFELIEHKNHRSLHQKEMSGYHRGRYRPRTDDHRARLSAALKGKLPWNTGKRWSDEAKAKQSIAHKGQHSSPRTQFQPGEHRSPATQFKPGQTPWNKGLKKQPHD